MQNYEKRGSWSESCKSCSNYESNSKRCKKLDIQVNEKDWCNDYEAVRNIDKISDKTVTNND